MEKATEFMHLLRPSAQSLRHRRAAARPRLRGRRRQPARRHRAEHRSWPQPREALATFAKNPVVTLGLEDFTQTLELGNPLARRARARAGELQLHDAGVPQPREPVRRRASASARWPAPLPCSRRPGPTTRASRPRRRPTGLRSTERAAGSSDDHRQQPPALQPLPERRRPGPAAGVRSGQRDLRGRARP